VEFVNTSFVNTNGCEVEVMAPGVHHVAPGQAVGEAAGETAADVLADVFAVASLGEPTRRRIYDHVRAHPGPVSRDEVADALGVGRRTAAFHLDRLAEQGLLAVSFARRSGRSGPGAGRPAKLYQRSSRVVSVSLPPRHYDVAGRLLAGAFVEAQQSGEPPRDVLDRRARDLGRSLAGRRSGGGDKSVLLNLLEVHGYEPNVDSGDIVLNNCPFHAMAQEHTELVCGMNLNLLEGLLDGLDTTGLRARLDPGIARCCVRLECSDTASG
jgi:predicted ArsR family transcriptional regulator